MNNLSGQNPEELDPRDPAASGDLSGMPAESPQTSAGPGEPGPEHPMFEDVFVDYQPPPERIPNFGHFGILFLLVLAGYFCADTLARLALYFHLFGVHSVQQARNDIHYTLGTEGFAYLIAFGFSLLVFPFLWRKRFFAGLQWRADIAWHFVGRLFSVAAFCFLLALVNMWFVPGPSDSPIDRIFRMPGAAWILAAFGVTVAPFFEEMVFRGFLLPALCTSIDWAWERSTGAAPRPLDEHGHPQWSLPAMSIAALVCSVPFALMHASQTAYALGPFVLLLCVSLVISWVRLISRSLAASVVVHACYNFLLFAFMYLGTQGFRHLEKM